MAEMTFDKRVTKKMDSLDCPVKGETIRDFLIHFFTYMYSKTKSLPTLVYHIIIRQNIVLLS